MEIGETRTRDFITQELLTPDGSAIQLMASLNGDMHNARDFTQLSSVGNIIAQSFETMELNASTMVDVLAPTATLNGDLMVTDGNVVVEGSLTAHNVMARSTMLVMGDLEQMGNTVSLLSDNVEIEDPVLLLNGNIMVSGMNAGFCVDRYQPESDTPVGDVIEDTAYETGNALNGATNAIFLDPPEVRPDGFYNDWFVYLSGGTGSGQVRKINSYLDGNGIAYVNTDFTIAPDNTSCYELYPCKCVVMQWNEAEDVWEFGCTPTADSDIVATVDVEINDIELEEDVIVGGQVVEPVPCGSITPTAADTAPDGWLMADGTQYNVVDFPDLYGVIGNTYGGDEGTVFNVPDLCGRVAYGMDPAIPSFDTLGNVGGVSETVLTMDHLAPHAHTITTATDPATDLQHSHATDTTVSNTTSPANPTGTIDRASNSVTGYVLPDPTPLQHSHTWNTAAPLPVPHTHAWPTPTAGTINSTSGSVSNTNVSLPFNSTSIPGGTHPHPNKAFKTYIAGTSGPINLPVPQGGGQQAPQRVSRGGPTPSGAANITVSPNTHLHPYYINYTSTAHAHNFPHTHNFVVNAANQASVSVPFPHSHPSVNQTTVSHAHNHSVDTSHTHAFSESKQTSDGNTAFSLSHAHAAVASQSTGGGAPIVTLSPYLVLNYMIKT